MVEIIGLLKKTLKCFLKVKLFRYLYVIYIKIHKKKNAKFIKIIDYFKQSYPKRALLVYITEPFESQGDFYDINNKHVGHTNFKEARYIAKALDNNKYSVDIVHFLDNSNIDTSGYHLILGFGYAFEKSFFANHKAVRIFYGTGQHPLTSNKKTLKNLEYFNLKYHRWLFHETRYVSTNWPLQYHFADIYVTLGNAFVKQTYKDNLENISTRSKLFSINIFFHRNILIADELLWLNLEKRNKNHFCWFGSEGIVHKGLLTLIKAFNRFKEYKKDARLLIFGANKSSIMLIKEIVFDLEGILFCGTIDLSQMNDLLKLNTVRFNVFPSASEGGAAAPINLLAATGIPTIASQEIGLDANIMGLNIADNESDTVYEALVRASLIDKIEYNKIVKNSFDILKSNYTENKYLNSWIDIIKNANISGTQPN
jgi:glycosyltransferase involved in cell wall biosynthesis